MISTTELAWNWEYVIVSDLIITAAYYINITILVLVTALLALLIFFRVRLIHLQKRHARLTARWRPLITQMLITGENTITALPPSERFIFLEEWNRMFGSIKGDNLERLVKLAHELNIHKFALRLLKKRNMRLKLFAVITLGHMRAHQAWDTLQALLQHPNTLLSLSAARALMWIDDQQAIDLILPVVQQRDDWPWSNVAHLLKQSTPANICSRLADTTLSSAVDKQPGLLRFLETCNCTQLTDVFYRVLKETDDDRVASTCLHIITDPRALPEIRKYTHSSRWHVRMHAASALGRLGNNSDRERLLQLTSDREWWVRYRAAQALLALPGMNQDKLLLIREQSSDRYSRDIISQALAEDSLE